MSEHDYYLVKVPKKSLTLNLTGDVHFIEFISSILEKSDVHNVVEHVNTYKKDAKYTQKYVIIAGDEKSEVLGKLNDEAIEKIEKTQIIPLNWYKEGEPV